MALDIAIRRAEMADASSLAALSIEVWLGTYIREGVNRLFADHALSKFTTERLRSRLTDRQRSILVSQNVVGIDGMVEMVSGAKAPVDGCSDVEIATLYVQPRHQGTGRGIALLEAALAHVQSAGHHGVHLLVYAENKSAVAFYERHKFERAGETYYQIEDQRYLNYVMHRSL